MDTSSLPTVPAEPIDPAISLTLDHLIVFDGMTQRVAGYAEGIIALTSTALRRPPGRSGLTSTGAGSRTGGPSWLQKAIEMWQRSDTGDH
ncbi:MAG: hypothetical protein MUO19_07810 [Dehalococcoidales bacterium]|nr:hypothetical protein [Dehalococcoidales bacterium]